MGEKGKQGEQFQTKRGIFYIVKLNSLWKDVLFINASLAQQSREREIVFFFVDFPLMVNIMYVCFGGFCIIVVVTEW